MKRIREFLIDEEVLASDIECLLEQMESLRQECFANLSVNEMQKKDYLKLTFELGSCLEKIIVENNLEEPIISFSTYIQKHPIFLYYDPKEEDYWKNVVFANHSLSNYLNNISAVLLGNAFGNIGQSYHAMQSIKYLTIDENKDFIYHTISPVNSIAINYQNIPEEGMYGYLTTRLGLTQKSELEGRDIVRDFINSQGFFINIPIKLYPKIQKDFPLSRLTPNSTKVVFGDVVKNQENLFDGIERFLNLDYSSKDDTIVSSIRDLNSMVVNGEDIIEEKVLRKFINNYNRLTRLLNKFNLNQFYQKDIEGVDVNYSKRIKRDKPKIERFYNRYNISKGNLSPKERSDITNKLKEYEYICYVWKL